MKSIDYCSLAILGTVSILTAVAGCSKSPAPVWSAAQTNETVRLTSPITAEQAVALAELEVKKRGWTEFRVQTNYLTRGVWRVVIEVLPPIFGGHAAIEVPTNGGVINYIPGR